MTYNKLAPIVENVFLVLSGLHYDWDFKQHFQTNITMVWDLCCVCLTSSNIQSQGLQVRVSSEVCRLVLFFPQATEEDKFANDFQVFYKR